MSFPLTRLTAQLFCTIDHQIFDALICDPMEFGVKMFALTVDQFIGVDTEAWHMSETVWDSEVTKHISDQM